MRARLETAIPVDPANQPRGEVRFGARVELRAADGTARTLLIVGEDEAAEGGDLVAWTAPFAQALFGLKAGAALDWDGEKGPERWTVAEIEYPA